MKNLKLFTSKANTLDALNVYDSLNIPPFFIVSAKEWKEDKKAVLEKLFIFALCNSQETNEAFHDSFVVRSSSMREDNKNTSGAGAFLSILHVSISKNKSDLYKENSIEKAIEKVFDSYGQICDEDQVLIQPMVHSSLSGVITTKALSDGSPYYVINYDDESVQTDKVTSGVEGTKTVFIYKKANENDFDSKRLYSFIKFAQEIENKCNSDELDIEFCLDSKGKICLLQVRPLCTQHEWIIQSEEKVASNVNFIIEFLKQKMTHQENLFGNTTILGCMPDWNPAEMIGVTPRLLASSLYRNFITHRIWALARTQMGYKETPPDELMILLAGRPFIDVRLSFNSFLPAEISETTGEVLINAWLERLNKNPQLHDKIEFEIASTVMTFDFDKVFFERYPNLLSVDRYTKYKEQLAKLTRQCIDLTLENNSMKVAYDAIIELNNRQKIRRNISSSDEVNASKILSRIVAYSENCQTLGTLPFSILARHGFIAESLLRSAINCGAISKERVAEFKSSIKTVSGEMSHDFQEVQKEKLSKEAFLEKYGHLRPNTYDILSPSYKEREGLFDGTFTYSNLQDIIFTFTEEEKDTIKKLLEEANLPSSIENFEEYIRKAIEGREFAKFVFTKSISDILDLITLFGKQYNIDKEMLSYIDIRDIVEWSSHALLREPKDYFYEKYLKGKHLFDVGRSLKLSYIIRSPRDVFVVPQHRNTPNFIGSGCVERNIVVLDGQSSCSEKLDNCIVCIENADPGFDWIFTRSIAGLITKFGGANSHMAIRCAEYSLPAAIGVGEVLFEQVIKSNKCILSIENNSIKVGNTL